jgi:hypothetical protein
MPDEALMLFPPGLADRSRSATMMPWEVRVEAAERPARPEPTTIARRPSLLIVDIMPFVIEVEARRRHRMDARAMKRERDMSVRILLRDIDLFVK